MALLAIIGIVLLGIAIYAPQYWVRHVIKKHSHLRDEFPGTGGELAEHLIKHYRLEGVKVEKTSKGDHYDPERRVIALGKEHFEGKSIAAIAVAAHEFGHAVQHYRGEKLLSLRQFLVGIARVSDLLASIFFFAAPVLGLIARTPLAFLGVMAIGIAFLAFRIVIHLVTLPVEYDASFNKALPILKDGGYLDDKDMPAARQVLRAAAFTYVAGALMSLIDLARWVRVLR